MFGKINQTKGCVVVLLLLLFFDNTLSSGSRVASLTHKKTIDGAVTKFYCLVH